MSLFDTDKTSEDRGSPFPNRPDQLLDGSIKAHKTISTQYKTGADTSAGQLQMANKQLIANDGSKNKALVGFQQGLGQWGVFVAEDGVDVNTNTDLSKFIFNSNQDVLKVVIKLTTSIPAFTTGTGGTNYSSITIPHGQLSTPLVQPYARGNMVDSNANLIASTYVPLPLYLSGGTGKGQVIGNYWFSGVSGTYYPCSVMFAVDSTNIYFEAACNTSSGAADTIAAIPITYFVLQETAS